MENCIFCKIAKHQIPTEFFYEDKDVMAFPDINPISPIHILVMPKKHTKDFVDFKDLSVFQKVTDVIQKMVKDQKLKDKGYRVVINGRGAQIVDHLHFHLIGPLGKKVSME